MTVQALEIRLAAAAAPPPPPRQTAIKAVAGAGIADSLVFDHEWYLAAYPDVARADADPVRHYLAHGASENRNPNRSFDTRWYLEQYPDVLKAGINPFLHYVLYGYREGRLPSGLTPRPTRALRTR